MSFPLQVLFWVFSVFMSLFNSIKFPFLQRLRSDYPYNNLKGKLCSGYGIHASRLNEKDQSLNLQLVAMVVIYLVQLVYFSYSVKRLLRKFTSKASGKTVFNSKLRYS